MTVSSITCLVHHPAVPSLSSCTHVRIHLTFEPTIPDFRVDIRSHTYVRLGRGPGNEASEPWFCDISLLITTTPASPRVIRQGSDHVHCIVSLQGVAIVSGTPNSVVRVYTFPGTYIVHVHSHIFFLANVYMYMYMYTLM